MNTREKRPLLAGNPPAEYQGKRPLLAGKTHIGRKENPQIMLQLYVKGLYASTTNNNFLCLWLKMPAKIEPNCNLKKTEPPF